MPDTPDVDALELGKRILDIAALNGLPPSAFKEMGALTTQLAALARKATPPLDSQQIKPEPTLLAHRTTACVNDLVESYRNAVSFKGLEEAFAVVVQLADLARECAEWDTKRLIVSGPIRYQVLGPENVKNHETVHDFIEVLSPPSVEATNAISAHTDLVQQLSNTLEALTAANARIKELEAMCEWLAREGYLLIKEAREDVMRAHDALVGYESEDAMLADAREAVRHE